MSRREGSLRIKLLRNITRQKFRWNPLMIGTIEGEMWAKKRQAIWDDWNKGLEVEYDAVDDDDTVMDDAEEAKSPPRLVREEDDETFTYVPMDDDQADTQGFSTKPHAEEKDQDLVGHSSDQVFDAYLPESPRLEDSTDDFDSSSSSSDEEDSYYPPPPPGLSPRLGRWTPINAHEPPEPLDSDEWGDGINPSPLPSIEEDQSEPERVLRIVPMAKFSMRVLAVKERTKQTLPAIFRHRVYTRSPLARETLLGENHKTGKSVTRYGEHLGRGIIGDWNPNDGFPGDWRTKCQVCKEECKLRGRGWTLTKDAAASDTDSERSPSTFSIPTTVDDEELTDMEKYVLEGRVPDEMDLDPALK